MYVFLGEHIALADFVKVLQRRGLLQTGDYAVVAVDDEIYDPSAAAIVHAGKLSNFKQTCINHTIAYTGETSDLR